MCSPVAGYLDVLDASVWIEQTEKQDQWVQTTTQWSLNMKYTYTCPPVCSTVVDIVDIVDIVDKFDVLQESTEALKWHYVTFFF